MKKQKLIKFFRALGLFPLDSHRHTLVIEFDIKEGKNILYFIDPIPTEVIVITLRTAANQIELKIKNN